MAGDPKKVIQPKPIPGMPMTHPNEKKKKKRPSLGSGGAEQAAQDLEKIGLRRRKAIRQATGRSK